MEFLLYASTVFPSGVARVNRIDKVSVFMELRVDGGCGRIEGRSHTLNKQTNKLESRTIMISTRKQCKVL